MSTANIALWVASGLLAAIFLLAGLSKALQPREKLMENPNLAWMQDFTARTVKTIGVLETLGAIGVILPWLTGILRVLTPLAAVGLAVIMIEAMVVHGGRKEGQILPLNGVLLLLALFVAIGRFVYLVA